MHVKTGTQTQLTVGSESGSSRYFIRTVNTSLIFSFTPETHKMGGHMLNVHPDNTFSHTKKNTAKLNSVGCLSNKVFLYGKLK